MGLRAQLEVIQAPQDGAHSKYPPPPTEAVGSFCNQIEKMIMNYDAALFRKKRERAKAFVDGIRKLTFCSKCGSQPVEWHSDRHLEKPHLRISGMVCRANPNYRIIIEMAKCEALYRRCHMKLDGRMNNLCRDWQRGVPKKRREKCKNGHVYTMNKHGTRQICKLCNSARAKLKYLERTRPNTVILDPK